MKNTTQYIAKKLKALRKEKGWSLDKTSEATDVSKAMLGQIEREESSPTIATLWKIAKGFHVSFSEFVEEPTPKSGKPLHRSIQSSKLSHSNKKMQVSTLFPFDKTLRCEMFVITLLPGCEQLSPAHEQAVIEHIFVIEGTVEILLNAKWKKLQAGEALRFFADKPHGYRNTTLKNACFHNTIHYVV